YDDDFKGGYEARREGRQTVARALTWLEQRKTAGESWFLFVHLFDAHGPYAPPPEYRGLFRSRQRGPMLEHMPGYQSVKDELGRPQQDAAGYVDRYDDMLRVSDDALAPLLAAVGMQDTAIVLVADPGEAPTDRYWVVDHSGH